MAEIKKLKIVAITGCAAGIAHTFMAAENISKHFSEAGHKIKVETHGTAGPDNVLTAKEIRDADYVLIAADINVTLERFVGKMTYVTDTHKAISKPSELFDDMIAKAKKYKQSLGKSKSGDSSVTADDDDDGFNRKKKNSYVVKHIMYAMGWMIPLVIAAGITMAVGNMFSTDLVWNPANGGYDALWGFTGKPIPGALFDIGAAGMSLIYPVIGAGIAYSISGKLSFAPGFIGGWLMNQGSFIDIEITDPNGATQQMGMGFLGAIVVGLFVGYLVHFAKMIRWNKNLKGIAQLMIVPLVTVMITGLMSKYALAPIIAPIVVGMNNGLIWLDKNMGTSGAILIGAIIGAMIASDLGGPINKTAMMFGTAIWMASVEANPGQPHMWNFIPGTASQAAIGVPPLMAFLSTQIFPSRFTTQQKSLGMNAGIMSLFGISEGAIPFAAVKPLIFIPANMFAGAMAGMLVSAMDFQFYGGLGSPLGAVFGYIPLGGLAGSPYSLSMILWFLVVVSAALMGTALIYLGYVLSDRNSVYKVKKDSANEVYLEAKAAAKKKFPKREDAEKYKAEVAKAREEYKAQLPELKVTGRAEYADLLKQKQEGKKLERSAWATAKAELKKNIETAKANEDQDLTAAVNEELSKIHEAYKLERATILRDKDVHIFKKYDVIKAKFEDKIDAQREEAIKLEVIEARAAMKKAKRLHDLEMSKFDDLTRV